MIPDHDKAARDILAFYLEAGVDALLDEAPANRFGEASAAAQPDPAIREVGAAARAAMPLPSLSAAAAPPMPPPPPSPEEAVMAARAAAAGASSLDELRAILEKFEGCSLRATATRLVFGDGNPKARLMLCGEAPGRDEDIEGRPFVGRSGKLLDLMLASIGLDRTSVYIANVVPWRPPGNREPSLHEVSICLPFIKRQIELVDPDILVCLGKPSMAALLGISEGIRRARGRWVTYNTGKREIAAMPTYHPAYLLRSPLEKRMAWRDMLAIRKALAQPAS